MQYSTVQYSTHLQDQGKETKVSVMLGFIIFILPCLSLATDSGDVSETNLGIMVHKLEALEKRVEVKLTELDRKMAEFEKIKSDAMGEIDTRLSDQDGKLGDLDKRVDQMEETAGMENLRQSGEKIESNLAENSTDLEERVSELEDQMIAVEDEVSDMKLGLAAIADRLDELQEAENVQNENILFLQQEVSRLYNIITFYRTIQ